MPIQSARLCLATLFLLTLCGLARASDYVIPEQKIVGVEEPVPLGELVDLSVSPITDKPEHYHSSSYAWRVIDLRDGKEVRLRPYKDNGREGVFFGAGIRDRKLKAFCAITHLYVVKDGDRVTDIGTRTVLLTTDIVIGKTPEPGPGPDPGPGPGPGPNPNPDLPDGRYKLAAFVYDAARTKVAKEADRVAGARALSASFSTVATMIVAASFKTDKEVLQATKTSNDKALGSMKASWEPFSDALENKLYDLYQQKQIKTLPDYADAWREIAQGLSKVGS